MMSKLRITFLALLTTLTFSTAYAAEPFNDVNEGNTHYLAINYLRENGIIRGYDDNSFRSYEKINRAEALKMITLATGLIDQNEVENGPNLKEKPFPDVYQTIWYAKYIQAAKERGIINGNPDGNFNPEDNVNLVEALKIYYLSKDTEIPDIDHNFLFADTEPDEWFAPYTAYAGSKSILDVNSDNTIDINQELTRGYLAEIIYRAIMAEQGYEFGKSTWYGAAVQGHKTASGETFDYNLLTAAHRYLPMGSYVEVTNLANGKSVTVKINDRGPYGFGRVIDLSSGAFKEIASLGAGVIRVQLKVTHLP